MARRRTKSTRVISPWTEERATRHSRADGAVVAYDVGAVATGSKPWIARHRGWVAYGPGKPLNNFLGYYRRFSRVKIPRKFRDAKSAMRSVDDQFPFGEPGRWRFDGPQIEGDPLPLDY